jgi:glycosyltransferase involved in cell wall biosynthesis
MVTPPFMEFGGLEKIATQMALALRDAGHAVSVLTIVPAAPKNQYVQALRLNHIPLAQPPAWLWAVATSWEAKIRVASWLVRLASPLVALAALGLMAVRRQSWRRAWLSSRGRAQAIVMQRLGPDFRRQVQHAVLAAWRRWWRLDLLHLHGYTDSLVFVLDWAQAHRVPTVYAENQTPDPSFDWWQALNRSINHASVVLAASDISARALREMCGVTRPIRTFLPIVPDPWAGKNGADRGGEAGTATGLQVTTIARLYVTKGLTYLLEAIAQVRQTHPDTRFKVYGDGPLRDELMDYAAKLGLDGKEIFAGAFVGEELPNILGHTDLFVSSSVLEGLPLAVVEAMAYGLPIVATAAGGVPEIIRDGETGCLCPPREAGCLARHITRLIEDPARRRQLGQTARQAYEHGGFTPGAVAHQLTFAYEEALKSS